MGAYDCYPRSVLLPSIPQPKVDTLFARPYKHAQLEPVRVELYNDRLVVYRHDVVYEDVLANNVCEKLSQIFKYSIYSLPLAITYDYWHGPIVYESIIGIQTMQSPDGGS